MSITVCDLSAIEQGLILPGRYAFYANKLSQLYRVISGRPVSSHVFSISAFSEGMTAHHMITTFWQEYYERYTDIMQFIMSFSNDPCVDLKRFISCIQYLLANAMNPHLSGNPNSCNSSGGEFCIKTPNKENYECNVLKYLVPQTSTFNNYGESADDLLIWGKSIGYNIERGAKHNWDWDLKEVPKSKWSNVNKYSSLEKVGNKYNYFGEKYTERNAMYTTAELMNNDNSNFPLIILVDNLFSTKYINTKIIDIKTILLEKYRIGIISDEIYWGNKNNINFIKTKRFNNYFNSDNV